ncbi:hypothetical protein BC629DRAFT_496064 [Irpex lacteus]|nr:hypothetical protein BC629DRAFT_496064 [Irpex lacteus]
MWKRHRIGLLSLAATGSAHPTPASHRTPHCDSPRLRARQSSVLLLAGALPLLPACIRPARATQPGTHHNAPGHQILYPHIRHLHPLWASAR